MEWRIYADRGGNLGVWEQVGSRTAYVRACEGDGWRISQRMNALMRQSITGDKRRFRTLLKGT